MEKWGKGYLILYVELYILRSSVVDRQTLSPFRLQSYRFTINFGRNPPTIVDIIGNHENNKDMDSFLSGIIHSAVRRAKIQKNGYNTFCSLARSKDFNQRNGMPRSPLLTYMHLTPNTLTQGFPIISGCVSNACIHACMHALLIHSTYTK